MDFITVSRCILREGERVLLNLDNATYREVLGLVSGLRVPDKAMHNLLMNVRTKGGMKEDAVQDGVEAGAEAGTRDGMEEDAVQDGVEEDAIQDSVEAGMQDGMQNAMQDGMESVQLAAYYVLGDTAETEALPLPDACLRLIVLVHSQELEHDAFQHDRDADVIIFAKLFNGTGMRVDVARDANKPLVEHLVRQAKPTEAVARVGLGADKRSIWQ